MDAGRPLDSILFSNAGSATRLQPHGRGVRSGDIGEDSGDKFARVAAILLLLGKNRERSARVFAVSASKRRCAI